MAKFNKCVDVRKQCLTIVSLERDPQVLTAAQRVNGKKRNSSSLMLPGGGKG